VSGSEQQKELAIYKGERRLAIKISKPLKLGKISRRLPLRRFGMLRTEMVPTSKTPSNSK
jgi:hypothetical protein